QHRMGGGIEIPRHIHQYSEPVYGLTHASVKRIRGAPKPVLHEDGFDVGQAGLIAGIAVVPDRGLVFATGNGSGGQSVVASDAGFGKWGQATGDLQENNYVGCSVSERIQFRCSSVDTPFGLNLAAAIHSRKA